jgi:hypothetical protein
MKKWHDILLVTGVAWALALSLETTAAANGFREKGALVTVAKLMRVQPPRDWNQLSLKPGKKAETWTLDGEQLNDVTFFGGIAPGEPLIRESSKKRAPLPKLTRDTLLVELPELLETTYRTEKKISQFKLTGSAPMSFVGHEGIGFTYEYTDNDNLPRMGEARASLARGKLYMVTYDAPRLHFFQKQLLDFRALADTIVIQ